MPCSQRYVSSVLDTLCTHQSNAMSLFFSNRVRCLDLAHHRSSHLPRGLLLEIKADGARGADGTCGFNSETNDAQRKHYHLVSQDAISGLLRDDPSLRIDRAAVQDTEPRLALPSPTPTAADGTQTLPLDAYHTYFHTISIHTHHHSPFHQAGHSTAPALPLGWPPP